MCGICGFVYHDRQHQVDFHLVKQMTDIIQHRGPDDEGHFIDQNVALGSRRLSIVGLSDGHMPMHSKDGSIVIVYNGELYNHPELKKQLQSKGYTYHTHSDTESLIHLYHEYGLNFLEHTQGMFGLALWDKNENRLILGRDRLGIKPLYYQIDHQALRFGSEIKSILCDASVPREINLDALNLFLSYLSTPAPYTMFKGIRQLMPGEMLIYKNGDINLKTYWPKENSIQPIPNSHEEWKTDLRRKFETIVDDHLMADVPVGAFLSGGIDSSILAALMHKKLGSDFSTFSIGFTSHSLFDETQDAKAFANKLGTNHYERLLSPNDLLSAMDDITWQYDEPLADSSSLPVYFVSQLAAQHVKVVLSGDGGDEIFAGYRKYQAEYFRRYVDWLPTGLLKFISHQIEPLLPESRSNQLMDKIRQMKKFFRGIDPDPFMRHLGWAIHYEDSIRKSLFHEDVLQEMNFEEATEYRRRLYDQWPNLDKLTRMLWVDLRHNLPADMLMKVDRMSMLHSLEVRVPFLDHQMVEWAFSLPDQVKLNGKTTKWILKESFRDLLPDDIISRRKHGFDVPVGEWFRHELRDVIEDVCSTNTITRRGLFNPQRVHQVLKDHQDGKRDYNNHLWILLSLENWQRLYLDSPQSVPQRPVAVESP